MEAAALARIRSHGSTQVALVGNPSAPEFRELDAAVAMTYVSALVLAGGLPTHDSGVALLDGRPAVGSMPTAYVCHGYVCDRPVTDAAAVAAVLEKFLG